MFCNNVFPISGCPPEFLKLSLEILSICQGFPLAIVAVGGLLEKNNNSTIEWKRVLDNLNYEFEKNHELSAVSKILLQSYYDLSYHMKLCFLHFGIFLEDFEIHEHRLLRRWIAEGFIELRKDMMFEQIVDEYLTW